MAQQGGIQDFSWEGRSHGQLQEIVQRGIAGGDEFIGAVREMERRSREHARMEEAQALEDERIKRERRLQILAAITSACFLALLGWLWISGS